MTVTVDTTDSVVVQVFVPGTPGPRGWVPVLAVVQDGARTVQRVVDYTGGALPKPATGLYVGPEGLVASISDATDMRGATGPTYNPRGEWDYQATYLPLDTVSYQGSSYVAKDFGENPNVNVVPSGNPDWWDLQLDGSGAANDRAAAETAAGMAQTAASSAASASSTTATNAGLAITARTGAESAQAIAETARDAAQQAVANPSVAYDTLTALNADLAHAAGTVGQVLADSANTGFYVKSGAAGSGSWAKKSSVTVPALGVLADANQITVGELLSTVAASNYAAANGATTILSGGFVEGMSVPASSLGTNSYFAPRATITADQIARFVGCTIYMVAVYDATANLLAERPQLAGAAAQVRRGSSTIDTGTVERIYQSGTKIVKVVSFVLGSTDTGAGVKWQFGAPVNSANTHTVQLASLSWYPVVPGVRRATSLVDDLLDLVLAPRISAAISTAYAHRVYVGPAATYPTITDALAAITDASSSNRYEIAVYSNVYTDVEGHTKNYVDIRGIGPVKPWLKGYLPPETAPATIAATSTLWLNTRTKLTNLRITAQNMRYPVHAETDNVPGTYDIAMTFEDCDIEHLGNDEARAYQAANGGLAVWASEFPVGHGTSSGAHLHYERCRLSGPAGGLHGHTRASFVKPSMITARGSTFSATREEGTGLLGGYGAILDSLGSGQSDIVVLDGCSIVGPLVVQPGPWYQSTLSYQPAVRNEYAITLINCSPAPYLARDKGTRALKIESTSTLDTSSVAVSGSAVAVLFGDVVTYPAGGGLNGAVWGAFDVSGALTGPSNNLQITGMGKRLGNRTSSPVDLVITVDGGSPVTVTFDGDYTSVSNTTILATINSALGASATASLYNTELLYRPNYTTEELVLLNTSTEAIRQKHLVAYNTSDKNCRKMTSSDTAAQFAGIAMEDIRPGQRGRVHAHGAVRVSVDLIRSDSGSFALGDTFGVGATPGEVIKSASIPLLRAYNTLDVRWG